MTLEYFDRWAAWPSNAIAAEVAGMQWSHSILQEPCYKSPWQASEDALHLAFTLQPDSLVRHCEKREWGFSVPHKRCKKGLAVSFNPFAHVHFGPEFSSSWTTCRVPTAGVSKRDWLPKSSTFSQSLCNDCDENFSSQQILAQSSPKPIECRPDLTENPNLPDPPSSSEGSEGRGRPRRVPIRHLPAWVETLWNILQDEGATELLEEGPVIYLSTFYLSHRNCIRQAVSRPIRLTRRYEEWNDEFKQVWGDLFDHDSDFSLFLVQPEPPISITRGIVGIVLIVQHEQPGGSAVLITALFDELPTPRTLEIAHVIDTWTDYTTVLHRAEAYEACTEAQRQGLRPCVLRAGRHVFPRERPVRVTDGLGIVINVPLLLNDEEWNTYVRPRIEQWPEFAQQPQPDAENDDDHVALMARRPRARDIRSSGSSRSTSSTDASTASVPSHIETAAWRRTVVFPLDGTAISCLLPAEPGPEQLYQIGIALPDSPGDVATAHIVSEKPADLVAMDLDCLLATKAHQMRPNPFMRLVLLDLEIFEENDILPGAFQRSAKWLPHTATKLSLFRILCLENLFMLHADKTSLWINNILIDSAANGALTIEDGDYIKIFIGNDEYSFQCTEGQDTMALLQTAITQATTMMQDRGHLVASSAVGKTRPLTAVCQTDDRPDTISLSFTDEFLRAVEAMRTAADAMPEFPEDDPGDITAYDPWVQRLHEAWTRAATIGPGGMERLGRVETWFTDHANFQRCHHTRIAVLGPDAHRWEEQLRHLWRQYLLLGAPLEFHMVEPIPEDASGQIIGQLLLVQRPHVYQRSVVISTYDNEYDQGRAHSTAVVMGTRVDLHSVCTMMQAHEDCPPENPENRCTLWIGQRPMEPRERVYARHGNLFKLVIQRALHANVAAASGTNLRERMRAIDARDDLWPHDFRPHTTLVASTTPSLSRSCRNRAH